MKILLATNNRHKIEEIKDILAEYADVLIDLSHFEKYPEPIENGASYHENAAIKALYYYRLTGVPTLADDSGLEIDALNGDPGIFSSRFIDPSLSFTERNHRVLKMLGDVPRIKRSARFRCCSVLVKHSNAIVSECGTLEGFIGDELCGDQGFGYDPIFYLPEHGASLAEIPPVEKNRISHRGIAFSKMKKHIDSLIGVE